MDFAGHPIIGAAATIHGHFFGNKKDVAITFQLKNKTVLTNSKKMENHYEVQMNQGKSQFHCTVPKEKWNKYVQG